ncbi:restriction endonuclease subunit S [Leyella stercorea]|uniref:restriction endonuclease subunit S n=1 Tax=Leyella stercorea TaxID=363265 RepID=UPI002430F429|nr:restriction endonuclease subunit S [Leyella stercorea]
MKQGWEHKKLGEVCTIERGGSPRPITDYITDSEDGINWIKIGDAQEGSKYITSTKEKIRPEGIKKSRFVHKGDFILSNSMSFGRPYILKVDGCIHDGWLVIHDDNEVFIKDYLYYILSSSIMYAKFSQLAVGGVVNNLNSSLVRKVAIPIPPKSTQLSIVSELDKINELIRLKKEQLKDYDNLAQSIFYEMFGDPVENEKGWEVKKLGEVCTIERGSSPRPITAYITDSKDGINWIKIGDAQEGSKYITSTKEKIKPEGLKKSRFVHKGDFILSNSMSFGKPYILKIDGCIHDGWLVIHDNNNVFIKIYLYYLLASSIMYAKFSKLAVGGVVNNLNSSLVRKVDVSIPPLPLQHIFAQRIEQIEHQKSEVTKAITDLETLLASRMQHWFE